MQLNKFFTYPKVLGFINHAEFGFRLNLTHADKYPLELCFSVKAFFYNRNPQEFLHTQSNCVSVQSESIFLTV